MRELGGILRKTRESLGLDLDEIESRTKIRKRYLVALEEGDWSLLPGRVYARGFVRSYAEVLGLDGLELLQQYVDGRDTDAVSETRSEAQSTNGAKVLEDSQPRQPLVENPEKQKPVAKPQEPRLVRSEPPIFSAGSRSKSTSSGPRGGGPIVQTAVIVAALVIVGGGYFAIHRHSHASARTNTLQTNTAVTSLTNQTTNTVANTVGGSVASPAQNTTQNTANTTSTPAKPAVVITPEPLKNGIRPYAVQNVSSLSVELRVTNGQLWLSSTADGNVVNGNDTVDAGQSRTYTAKQSVLLNLGHVQGIQILVNGQVLPLPNVQNPVNIEIVNQSH